MIGLRDPLRRFGLGGTVLVVTVILALVSDNQGVSSDILFPSIFALSATLTLLGLWYFESPRRGLARNTDVDALTHSVLLVEQESTQLQTELKRALLAYGAQVQALRWSSELLHAERLDEYDLIIADAQLPYSKLFELKSFSERNAPQRVFVVISVSSAYPASSRLSRIVDSSGPSQRRKELEELLSKSLKRDDSLAWAR